MKNYINRSFKLFVIFLLSVILLIICPFTFVNATEFNAGSSLPSSDDVKFKNSRVVVSMGDSYSSGEGLAPFYGDNHVRDLDNLSPQFMEWLAHRSKNDSWPGQLVLPNYNGTLNDYKVDFNTEIKDDGNLYWIFVASSGAEIKDIEGYHDEVKGKKQRVGQKKKFTYKNGLTYTTHLEPQIDTLKKLHDIGIVPDYITLTIGGNDMGFEDVITKAVTSTYLHPNGLIKELNGAREQIKEGRSFRKKLKDIYIKINKASSIGTKRPHIIVAGYPGLLDIKGAGLFFTKDEAALIDLSVEEFNKAISDVVSECKDKMDIEFVDVLPKFIKHEAYSDSPYINEVVPFSRTSNEDLILISVASARSMHPNKDGAKQYAECVQAIINRDEHLFDEPALTPTPSPTPSPTPLPVDTKPTPTMPSITTPTPLTHKTISVSNRYKKTRTFKTSYKTKKITCSIPQINIDGVDTSKTNDEMYKKLKSTESAFKKAKKSADCVKYARFEYYIGKGYVSIITWADVADMSGNGPYFYDHYVYNIDTTDGHIMTKKEALAKFGISADKFTEAVKKKTSVKYDPKSPMPRSEYHEKVNNTDAPKKAVPYINKSGKLCYATTIWVPGGPQAHDAEGVLNSKKKTPTPKPKTKNIAAYSETDISTAWFKKKMKERGYSVNSVTSKQNNVVEEYTTNNLGTSVKYSNVHFYRMKDKDETINMIDLLYKNAIMRGYQVNSSNVEGDLLRGDGSRIRLFTNVELFKSEGTDALGNNVTQKIFLKRKGNVVISVYSHTENLGTLANIDWTSEIHSMLKYL